MLLFNFQSYLEYVCEFHAKHSKKPFPKYHFNILSFDRIIFMILL